MPQDVARRLKDCLANEDGFVELRYHAKTSRAVTI